MIHNKNILLLVLALAQTTIVFSSTDVYNNVKTDSSRNSRNFGVTLQYSPQFSGWYRVSPKGVFTSEAKSIISYNIIDNFNVGIGLNYSQIGFLYRYNNGTNENKTPIRFHYAGVPVVINYDFPFGLFISSEFCFSRFVDWNNDKINEVNSDFFNKETIKKTNYNLGLSMGFNVYVDKKWTFRIGSIFSQNITPIIRNNPMTISTNLGLVFSLKRKFGFYD